MVARARGLVFGEMSFRDQTLIKASGRSAAQVAEVLDKARQSVSRGIRKDEDYFSLPDIVKLIRHIGRADEDIGKTITAAACEYYPELSASILASLSAVGSSAATIGDPGEYWLICPGLDLFRNSFSQCLNQIKELIADDGGDITVAVFVPKEQLRGATREFRVGDHSPQVIPCSDLRIAGMPTMLIHKDTKGGTALYGVGYQSFIKQPSDEAMRISDYILDHLKPEE